MTAALSELAVTGVGAVTSVGMDAAETAASVRARLAGLSAHTFYLPTTHDPGWDDEEPLLCAPVPGIDPFLPGPARLIELAALALADLVKTSRLRRSDLAEAALCIALPVADDAVATWGLAELFLPNLLRRTGLPPFATVRVVSSGHTGMLELLPIAASLFQSRTAARCILLGVDSYLTEDRLAVLDRAYRIKSERNVDGFLPGEGASALAIEPAAQAEARGLSAVAGVITVGLGTEPNGIAGDRQSSGAGLCRAITSALSARQQGAPWVLCDLNGESYRAFEWGIAQTRLSDKLAGPSALSHPADSFGDIGAATPGALIACAAMAFQRGYAPGPEAMVFCASDGGLRAAALVGGPA
jgi:3-oxoacyl-[acyl-carrier-protein] synthase-1